MSPKKALIILNILSFLQRAIGNEEEEPSPSLQWKILKVDFKISSTKQINAYTKQFVHVQDVDYFYLYYTLWYNTIFTAHFLNHAFPTLLSSVTECWHSSAKWLTYFSSPAAAELDCAKHIRKKIDSWKFLQTSANLPNKMNREEPISRPDCNHKTQ